MSDDIVTPPAPEGSAPEMPQAPKEAPKPVSPQFEALARKEAAIVKRQQELKRLEQELEGKRKTYETFEEKRSRAKTNPVEALEELGLSYEQITQYILNDKKPTADMEVASVKDELQKMREQFESKQKQEREAQEQIMKEQQESQVLQFKADLSDFVAEKAETFELLGLMGEDGVELVYDTMSADWQNKLKTYEEGGRIGRPPKVLSTEEACKLVEQFYEERVEGALKTKKFSSRLQPSPEKEGAESAPAALARTLNNGLVQPSAPSSLPAKNEQERIKRALLALG